MPFAIAPRSPRVLKLTLSAEVRDPEVVFARLELEELEELELEELEELELDKRLPDMGLPFPCSSACAHCSLFMGQC